MTSSEHSLDLSHGMELRCSLLSLDGSVRVALAFHDRELFGTVFRAGGLRHAVRHAGELVDLDLELWIDAFRGDVVADGHLRLRDPLGDEWHEILDVDRDVVLSFGPAIGQIGGSPALAEPLIVDQRFGRSQLCTPAVLRIFVAEEERVLSQVGKLVKRNLFPDHPPFVFNTVACVGQAEGSELLGRYTNPNSPWFNVFFGYYQLDSLKSDWSRPFGYRSAKGARSELEAEDILRLGKADWNFFSNWMYGVPVEHIEPYSGIDMASLSLTCAAPERIGSTLWHPLTLDDVEVASAYESDARGAARLVRNTALVDVWRHAFGMPNPQPDWPESFIPTRLRASMWVSYWEDEAAFHTTIFGGTLPEGREEPFLDAQMTAVRTVMERSYPTLGFETG